MFIRVSLLVAINLLFLVGCSGPSNNSNSDSPSISEPSRNTGITEFDISGCWKGSSIGDRVSVTDTHNLGSGGNYSGTREIISAIPSITNYSGKWVFDKGYVLIRDDKRDGTITLKVISEYELRQSGSSGVYSRC